MVLLSFLLMILSVYSHTAQEWRSRTIYQLLTDRFFRSNDDVSECVSLSKYCGGGFVGLMNHLDYIQNLGFDAIWISPIVSNTRNGYHGYWAQDFYEINPNFGSEQDLKRLISALHSRGMWIMIDVVANHIGPIGKDLAKLDQISIFNQKHHFHTYCPINWKDQWSVENCWLADLPDLNQSEPFVKENLLAWVGKIVKLYEIDGLRIDTCPQVPKWFWTEYAKEAGVFTMCEVWDGSIEKNSGYQGAVDSTLNYPLFYLILELFRDDASFLQANIFMKQASAAYSSLDLQGNFVNNHDNPRFLHLRNKLNRFKNAVAWSMTWPGIPIFYYGDEQLFIGGADPKNREILWPSIKNTESPMYKFVRTVVNYRKNNRIWESVFVERYADNNLYVFSRGAAMMAFSNADESQMRWVNYHPYQEGDVVCNVLDEDDCVTVERQGVPVYVENGECKLFQVKQKGNKEEVMERSGSGLALKSKAFVSIMMFSSMAAVIMFCLFIRIRHIHLYK